MDKAELRTKIVESLLSQGFYVNGHILPTSLHKNHFRQIQLHSRAEQINLQKKFLFQNLKKVQRFSINGWDINPNEIELEIRSVERGSIEETIYRWWNMTYWSVPYQKAYGRQLRFLLWDKAHNAPFGLIGLQSPILRMAVRDKYLGIPKSELDYWVNKSMQAQRLGALPPYNQLLGGKMVSIALTSNEIQKHYKAKYEGVKTVIKERIIEPELLFLTTTSAFGKSSIYNRLSYKGEKVAVSLGYTRGSGTFHVSQTLYNEIKEFLEANSINTSTTFGYGASRKVKLLYLAFRLLGLSNYHYHNIQREFFLFPLAKNLSDVIHKRTTPILYDRPLTDLSDFWKKRWAVPRFERQNGWLDFDSDSFFEQVAKELK